MKITKESNRLTCFSLIYKRHLIGFPESVILDSFGEEMIFIAFF